MKLLIIALMALSVSQTMALDVDFSGESRVRLTTEDLGGGGDIVDTLLDTTVELRNEVSASFRASEAFEVHSSLYLNQKSLKDDAELGDKLAVVAYADWMISDEFMVRLGQTQYELGNGLVIGSNDFQPLPTFFTGAIFTYSSRKVGVDVGLVQGPSDRVAGNLLIASVDIRSLPRNLRDANVHAVVTDFTGNNDPVYVGGSVSGDITRDVSFGANVSVSNVSDIPNSWLADAHVKYRMDGITAFAGAHAEGGEYTALYPETHYIAGKLDVAELGNGLTYGKVGAYYMVNRDMSVGAKAYYFHKGNGTVNDGDIEVDLSLMNKFNSSVSGKVVAGAIKQESATQVRAYANLSMKF